MCIGTFVRPDKIFARLDNSLRQVMAFAGRLIIKYATFQNKIPHINLHICHDIQTREKKLKDRIILWAQHSQTNYCKSLSLCTAFPLTHFEVRFLKEDNDA